MDDSLIETPLTTGRKTLQKTVKCEMFHFKNGFEAPRQDAAAKPVPKRGTQYQKEAHLRLH